MPADADDRFDTLERGLDALTTQTAPVRSRWRRAATRMLPPLTAVALVLFVWQAVVWAGLKPRFIFPSPGDVASELADQWRSGALPRAARLSLSRGAAGFALSVVIGTALGLLVARVRVVGMALRPILAGLQSLPSVAWVPAAIIWFTLSTQAIYAIVLLGGIPSVANGMAAGLDQVPPIYHRVGRVLGARGLKAAWFILLPAAMPGYIAGLKQGWAFSWRSLMAAELITQSPRLGTGLGQLLDNGRQFSNISLVFGMILVILAVGVAVDQIVFAPLERRVARRRGLVPA